MTIYRKALKYSFWEKVENPNFYIFLLFFSGLAWRAIHYALNFPQGGDETFVALSILTRDFSGMMDKLEYGQIAPVGFMWLELVSAKLFGFSGLSLRLIPSLGLILSLVLFWRLCLKILSPWETCIALGLFVASSNLSQAQVKPYAMDLLTATALLWAAIRVKESINDFTLWIIFTMIAVISVWLSYPSVFISGGLGLFYWVHALRKKNFSSITFPLIYSLLLVLSFGAMFLLGAKSQTNAASWLWKFKIWEDAYPPLTEPWRIPWWLIKTHMGFMFSLIRFDNLGNAIPTAFLAWLGFFLLIKQKRGNIPLLLLSPLFPAFIAASLKLYPYGGSVRTMLYMAPSFCILVGYGLSSLFRHLIPDSKVNIAFLVTSFALIVITWHSTIGDIIEPYNILPYEKAQNAFKEIIRKATPHDQWIIYGLNGPAPKAVDSHGTSYEPCFRYYVITDLKHNIFWNPQPEKIQMNQLGYTTVLVSRDLRNQKGNESQLSDFLNKVAQKLGPFKKNVFMLDEDPESSWYLEVYTFHSMNGPLGKGSSS